MAPFIQSHFGLIDLAVVRIEDESALVILTLPGQAPQEHHAQDWPTLPLALTQIAGGVGLQRVVGRLGLVDGRRDAHRARGAHERVCAFAEAG